MTRLFALVTLAMALAGCSGPEPAAEAATAQDPVIDLTLFSPEPELEAAMNGAVDDLNAHLGVNVAVGTNGVVFHAGDTEDGSCAFTNVRWRKSTRALAGVVVMVQVPSPAGCPKDLRFTVEHEAIHVLRAQLTADGEDANDHSEHGLFRAHVEETGDVIEETSAAMACASGYCALINLELDQ